MKILFLVIASLLVGSLIVLVLGEIEEKHYEVTKNYIMSRYFVEPFSVSEYIKRRNQLLLDLCEETKNIEPYIITLRLGYDALRLNADGTMEWINEKPKEEPSITNAWTPSYGYSLADVNTQTAIERLSRAWASAGVSAAQAAQNIAMMNAISTIRPAPSWYTSQLSSCCCSAYGYNSYTPYYGAQINYPL